MKPPSCSTLTRGVPGVAESPWTRMNVSTSTSPGAQFVLFGLSPAVEDVFRLTHVVRVFEVFQTEQEALES